MLRGQRVYMSDGELAFDIAINTKKDVGVHSVIFLEEIGENHIKIINHHEKIQVVYKSLISLFNI